VNFVPLWYQKSLLFAHILPVRAAHRVSGQKHVDDFLNEEGQIRLGKRQTRRQVKIVVSAR
jgi:hypothetical protein